MAKLVPHYNNEVIVAYDVDDTLVRFENQTLIEHKAHIESLKLHWYRGHHIIVWSAGGQKWVEYIIQRLGLQDFVHEMKAKPRWYVDDKKADHWMERYYLHQEGFNYGRVIGTNEEAIRDTKANLNVLSGTYRGSSVIYPLPQIQGFGCTITSKTS